MVRRSQFNDEAFSSITKTIKDRGQLTNFQIDKQNWNPIKSVLIRSRQSSSLRAKNLTITLAEVNIANDNYDAKELAA